MLKRILGLLKVIVYEALNFFDIDETNALSKKKTKVPQTNPQDREINNALLLVVQVVLSSIGIGFIIL